MVRAKRCCVHAYFRINGVSKRWFKTPKNVRLRSWLEQNADSGGSMNAKSHITTFKWRHINAFPVHLSSNNSLEQCAVHAHEIVFFSREAWTVLPWRAFWIGVLNQRFKTLILPSQNKHERSLEGFKTGRELRMHHMQYCTTPTKACCVQAYGSWTCSGSYHCTVVQLRTIFQQCMMSQ